VLQENATLSGQLNVHHSVEHQLNAQKASLEHSLMHTQAQVDSNGVMAHDLTHENHHLKETIRRQV